MVGHEPRGIDALAFSVDPKTEFTSLAATLLTYASTALKYMLFIVFTIDSINAAEAIIAYPGIGLSGLLQVLARSYSDTISMLVVYIIVSAVAAVMGYEHRRLVSRRLEALVSILKRAQGNSISLNQLRGMFKSANVVQLLSLANAWLALKGDREVIRLIKDPNNVGLEYVVLVPISGERVPTPTVADQGVEEGTRVFDIG